MTISLAQMKQFNGCAYECVWPTGGYHILEPHNIFVELLEDIWQCLWHSGPFHTFEISCSAKMFNEWLPWNIWVEWPRLMHDGDLGAPWNDVILIWCYYISICTLVTIFNWWLFSKDIKLRVLIKEALAVFHWITFQIILLCSLANGHRALLKIPFIHLFNLWWKLVKTLNIFKKKKITRSRWQIKRLLVESKTCIKFCWYF